MAVNKEIVTLPETLKNESSDQIAREDKLRRQHARHLGLLNRISQSLSEAKNFEVLTKKVLDGVIRALQLPAGALFLRDAANLEFSPGSHTRISLEFAETLHTLIGRVSGVLDRNDAATSEYPKHLLDRPSVIDGRKLAISPAQARFLVTVPLKSAGKTVGIVIAPSGHKKTLSREEKQLLTTLGSQTGLAIENALLLRKLSQLSMTDELTKLYNRRHFYEVLEIEMDRSRRFNRPLSLIILDIDRFKEVNDKFGHKSGDSVLKSLARTMTLNLRKTDALFRYGGDEFAVILPETGCSKAKDVIERLRLKWLHMPKTDLVLENPLGFSAGIAEFPKNAETVDSLMFLVDAALYNAKQHGGNNSRLIFEIEAVPHDMLAVASPLQAYSLAATIDAREVRGYGHSTRVADFAELIGKNLGLSNAELADLRAAGLLHDIGKIGIPGDILNKSGSLSPSEWEIVKMHAVEGAKIVGQINKISNLAPLIRHHHERYDGTGYPDGLQGQAIPLGSRIICVADAWDTMVTSRSYGSARSPSEALNELCRCSGTQFDPEIVKAISVTMVRAASAVQAPTDKSVNMQEACTSSTKTDL